MTGQGEMRNYRSHFFVLCILVGFLLTGVHNAFHNTITDMRFGLFPREASGDIVLVAIDPTSIESIGVWPWPRRLHAQLIDKLTEAGVTDIAFDIDFSSPSNPDADKAFSEALKQAGGSVVLPSFKQIVREQNGNQRVHVNQPLREFEKNSWQATVNVAADADGRVRHYSFGETLDGKFFPSVGALLAGKYETKQKQFQIDFSIRPHSVPRISYADVLRKDSKGLLEGKRVIVGGTAVELGDRFNVPGHNIIPGPVLQVLAAESILQGRTLHSSSVVVTVLGLGAMLLLMVFLWSRLSAMSLAFVVAGLALSGEAVAAGIQASWPIIIDTAYWHLAAIAYLITITLHEIDVRGLLARIAERRFRRIAMSLGDGLVCADRDGLITLWNPGAATIFGYGPADIIGQPIDILWCAADGEEKFEISSFSLDQLKVRGGRIFELRGLRKDGTSFALEACFSGWLGMDGINYGAVMRDISVRKQEEEKIRYLADHDMLTGLVNRRVLRQSLAEKIAEAEAKQLEVAILLLGVDHLKELNDTIGHARADEILRTIAQTLSDTAADDDVVARLSGDEFAIMLKGSDLAAKGEKLAESITQAIGQIPFSQESKGRRVTCSTGLVIYPHDSRTVDGLLANADLAMHRAKENGRNQHVFFHEELRNELEARRILETDLRRAMQNGEFELFYQPQVRLKDGKLVGAEALARWRHPERGLVPPDEFIPVLNAMPLSDRFARWVMETACRQGRAWEDNGFDIRIGVNLSPSQFRTGSLAVDVCEVLVDTGISPQLLELEVTENILIEDDKVAAQVFDEIQVLGVSIAFDDFGTGYASLSYLKRFNLDRLKIDKSFVQELQTDADDAAIVESTITLSKNLGLTVIAEGIEDSATLDSLLQMGCEEGQGYYFGRPMTAVEFEGKFLAQDGFPASDTSTSGVTVTAA